MCLILHCLKRLLPLLNNSSCNACFFLGNQALHVRSAYCLDTSAGCLGAPQALRWCWSAGRAGGSSGAGAGGIRCGGTLALHTQWHHATLSCHCQAQDLLA